jgi:hypothetical protein
MEIKKIIEGMTAAEVSEVIDKNFKAVDAEKADKKYIDINIERLESRTEYLTREAYEALKMTGNLRDDVEYNIFEEDSQ